VNVECCFRLARGVRQPETSEKVAASRRTPKRRFEHRASLSSFVSVRRFIWLGSFQQGRHFPADLDVRGASSLLTFLGEAAGAVQQHRTPEMDLHFHLSEIVSLVEADLGHELGEARIGAKRVRHRLNFEVNQIVDLFLVGKVEEVKGLIFFP
jgi:hypothetical protein